MTSSTPTDTAIGRAVLALDELIRTGNYGRFAELARTIAPTALVDQYDAAAEHVDGNLRAFANATGQHFAAPRIGDYPGWVVLGLFHAMITWQAGRGSTCIHAPDPLHPEPVAAAAWKPRLVVCGRCPHLLAIAPGSTKDRTCDGCGHITAGPEHDDGIWPGVVVAGPFTYALGVCTTCRWWT